MDMEGLEVQPSDHESAAKQLYIQLCNQIWAVAWPQSTDPT